MVCWRVCWCHFVDGSVNRWCEFAANAQICVAQGALARPYFAGLKKKTKTKKFELNKMKYVYHKNIGQ